MDLARINIQSQQAQIGLQQQRPTLSIRQRPADLQMHQELIGSFKLSSTASKLYIDQTEAFADADLKGPLRRSREYVAKAQQNVMAYIAETARHGEQLKKIENNSGNVFASIAKQKGERDPYHYNYANVPTSTTKVKFNYVPSELQVNIDWPDPNIRVRKNEPEISIPKWQTKAYLAQKNNIHFSVVGGNINKQL